MPSKKAKKTQVEQTKVRAEKTRGKMRHTAAGNVMGGQQLTKDFKWNVVQNTLLSNDAALEDVFMKCVAKAYEKYGNDNSTFNGKSLSDNRPISNFYKMKS